MKEENNKDCLFCKIVNKEIPSNIVDENAYALAFLDISPASDGHTLVIPKKHCIDLVHCDELYLKETISLAKKVADTIESSSLKPWGFNFLSNQGSIAGQVIFHFHLHVIPKYAKNEGLTFSAENKNLKEIEEVFKVLKKKNKKNS
ncbi:HIT family protein [Malacoplasma penetrans]|uniref:Histidine triad protein HIT n=1 Tax=Malacoplasma penetrans (strain HF-2) TaxID=272633 RepID=Q8EW55_MALP2|nr:HIT family protein [Malacoplasma penetrans]RXY96638.1 HIT family protein [Malacoplasma penetrans]BAC44141.1 histidine triad protein HIT [Malacoplasma penetrans HF-2]